MLKTLSQIKLPVYVKKQNSLHEFSEDVKQTTNSFTPNIDCGTSGPWTEVRVHNVLFEPLHGIKY